MNEPDRSGTGPFILTVNGEVREFDPGAAPATLGRLVEILGLSGAALVAEIDGETVAPSDFADVFLRPGARIELIRFVGGG